MLDLVDDAVLCGPPAGELSGRQRWKAEARLVQVRMVELDIDEVPGGRLAMALAILVGPGGAAGEIAGSQRVGVARQQRIDPRPDPRRQVAVGDPALPEDAVITPPQLHHGLGHDPRGEAENRIGEQFELFADRASSATMSANQLRLDFSAIAYVLIEALRRVALRHTQFADASVTTIRLKLFKLGAQVRTTTRRIHFAIASGCPNQTEFEMAHIYLRRAYPPP